MITQMKKYIDEERKNFTCVFKDNLLSICQQKLAVSVEIAQ